MMVNGSSWGNFGGERGLREGDPIFPYFFIMVAKVLGRGFLRKMEEGVFLSGESLVGEARAWKSVLDIYVANAR